MDLSRSGGSCGSCPGTRSEYRDRIVAGGDTGRHQGHRRDFGHANRFWVPIYHSHQPVADAVCVTQSRAAGAIILGKTVSTEFAFRRAGKTSNPHNRCYSPGGSSSGSPQQSRTAWCPWRLARRPAVR